MESPTPEIVTWNFDTLNKKLLARGTYADVYEIITEAKVRYAAKTIRLPLQLGESPPEILDRLDKAFYCEKRLCVLNHENIVKFYDMAILTKESAVVVFMELCEGPRLEKFIDGKPLVEVTVGQLAVQICGALKYLHTLKPNPVLHRDINTRTILVTEGMKIKLIDFGLANQLVWSASEHISADPRGDPCFMAPELFLSENTEHTPYSWASDVWAFGCTVYQMATGRRPHADCRNMLTIIHRVKNKGAPELESTSSDALKDFYMGCTVPCPKDRKAADDLLQHAFLANQRHLVPSIEGLSIAEYETFSPEPTETEIGNENEQSRELPFDKDWTEVKLLGRGGIGEVHEVVTDKNIRCAAKTIRPSYTLGDREIEKDIRDAIAQHTDLCELNHDNIVKFLGIVERDKTIVVFMELLEGKSLTVHINEAEQEARERVDNPQSVSSCNLSMQIVRNFSHQICCALKYLHSRVPIIIHRDIKSDNVVVTRGVAKLVDFDLTIRLMELMTHYNVSSLENPKGTTRFMAPELFSEERETGVYSRQSDIWAFGCVLYHMVTGSVPHHTLQRYVLMKKIKDDGAPLLPDWCSEDLLSFYNGCICRERLDRMTAVELLDHSFLRSVH